MNLLVVLLLVILVVGVSLKYFVGDKANDAKDDLTGFKAATIQRPQKLGDPCTRHYDCQKINGYLSCDTKQKKCLKSGGPCEPYRFECRRDDQLDLRCRRGNNGRFECQ